MNTDSPLPSPENPPVSDEHSLRQSLVLACQQIERRRLDPLGLLSMSLRASRSAAAGLIITSDHDAHESSLDSLQWHALQASPLPFASLGDSPAATPAPARPAWLNIHRTLLRELPAVNAVLMLAPVYASALACLPVIQRDGIPAFHPAVTTFGGDELVCASFIGAANPGDEARAEQAICENLLSALGGRHACFLASQGVLLTGQNADQLIRRAARIEALAHTYWAALQIGEPISLNAGQMHDSRLHWNPPA